MSPEGNSWLPDKRSEPRDPDGRSKCTGHGRVNLFHRSIEISYSNIFSNRPIPARGSGRAGGRSAPASRRPDDYKAALGADDGSLVGNMVEAVKGMVGKVADKLDPLTEQYAGLFKKGLRTPVMRKPSDYGMAFEEVWFPSMDGAPLEAWFIPAAAGHGVKVPTLTAQLRRDFLIHGEKDGQEIFDSLATETKELLWIEQSNQRFYA